MKTPRLPYGWLWIGIVLLAGTSALVTRDRWWPAAQSFVQSAISGQKVKPAIEAHDHDAAGGDAHDHGAHAAGHDEADSLELSAQARGNIGLTPEYLRPVTFQTFYRTITVPAIVAERPGRTRVQVSTPMAGVITHVHAVQGEAVAPGTLLFQIRITAEALVATQTDLLKSVGDIDVENREIARLTKATESGAIAQKSLLERQYAKEKLEVQLGAQRESLRLQGLSERQIEDITKSRKLLSELQIVAPSPDDHSHEELKLTDVPVRSVTYRQTKSIGTPPEANVAVDTPIILQEVRVHKGQTVAAGETLAVMADYSELYIEGQAFEQDLKLLAAAAEQGWKVTARIEEAGNQSTTIEGLDLVYSANEIHADSRTLPFFVRLPNTIARRTKSADGQTFVNWTYRLGQRLQLQIPVEEWKERLVLPVDAVAREGVDYFVFQQNGDHFDRVAVKVDYRDQTAVVVANDGTLFPGDIVALRGAHQMQMALKNKSGGGADPHAGHNH